MNEKGIHRRGLLAAGAGAWLAAPAIGRAATEYPGGQTVQIVIPYAPGGVPDILGTILTRGLAQRLGGTFVMYHRPGASTTLAGRLVAHAKPDGLTLLMGTVTTFTTAQYALRDPGFDPLADFVHATLIADTLFVLAAYPRWESFDALVAAAKQRPNALSYATWGVGTTAHLMMLDLMARTGTEMLHVPYSGAPPALTDTIAGRTDLMFSTVAPAKPHIESGRLRGFAITAAKRSEALPLVPTMAEIGIADFSAPGWFTVSAPAGTPPEIVAKIEQASIETFAEPEARARLENLGLAPAEPGHEALLARLTREAATNRELFRRAGIEPE